MEFPNLEKLSAEEIVSALNRYCKCCLDKGLAEAKAKRQISDFALCGEPVIPNNCTDIHIKMNRSVLQLPIRVEFKTDGFFNPYA